MQDETYDVVIVGAGAAGVGMGVVFRHLGIERFTILDRYQIGASFERWPDEMRFITPSFPSNSFGQLDLNAIALNTSPAFSVQREHPTGKEYAKYLRSVAEHFELPLKAGIEVQSVKPQGNGAGFTLTTSEGSIQSRFVVWAAGEFQYPPNDPFPGANLCKHNSHITTWREIEGDDIFIIGGYESGIDAAIHLSHLGKRVHVLDRSGIWNYISSDPSSVLSPHTHERLANAVKDKRIHLNEGVDVVRVEAVSEGFAIYTVTADGTPGQVWKTSVPPILATGFTGSLQLVEQLFDWHEEGYPLLTDNDEATLTPGLFLTGPSVQHGPIIFCFIYKFRQRFAVVANAIGEQLGVDRSVLDIYRQNNMFLSDLSCCDEECTC
ncbi:MAG: NAD(P)/FAD-dependent oxidoreductase [Chloroflexota bacterium]